MFCPGCGIQVADDTKFCKNCGVNIRGVREAMFSRGEKFDWSKTWVADMLLTDEEHERRSGITPEKKRNNEIRAGVITASVGLGVMIFLNYFMIAVANKQGNEEAEIIRKVWMAGIIPFLIGLAIILNGLILGRRDVKQAERQARMSPQHPLGPAVPAQLEARTTDQLSAIPEFSVSEDTTAQLPQREKN